MNRPTLEQMEEILDLFGQLRDAVEAAGLNADPRFRAYHTAQLEGESAGWLGGPFLADALHEFLSLAADAEFDAGLREEAL